MEQILQTQIELEKNFGQFFDDSKNYPMTKLVQDGEKIKAQDLVKLAILRVSFQNKIRKNRKMRAQCILFRTFSKCIFGFSVWASNQICRTYATSKKTFWGFWDVTVFCGMFGTFKL